MLFSFPIYIGNENTLQQIAQLHHDDVKVKNLFYLIFFKKEIGGEHAGIEQQKQSVPSWLRKVPGMPHGGLTMRGADIYRRSN